jgi:hypothetical protein
VPPGMRLKDVADLLVRDEISGYPPGWSACRAIRLLVSPPSSHAGDPRDLRT